MALKNPIPHLRFFRGIQTKILGLVVITAASLGVLIVISAALLKDMMVEDRKDKVRAVVELARNSPATAVPHLRRALIAAQSRRDDVPWMVPYLTANLIEALLLAGRLTEATAIASGFHGGKRDNGWNVVATLPEFILHRAPTDVAALPVAS